MFSSRCSAKHGYNVVLLKNDDRRAIDMGLKYVNNDACYPVHHQRSDRSWRRCLSGTL